MQRLQSVVSVFLIRFPSKLREEPEPLPAYPAVSTSKLVAIKHSFPTNPYNIFLVVFNPDH
jgi:hypothetical protein